MTVRLGVRLLEVVLALMGLALAGLFLWVATLRLAYPFELDWIEGTALQQALRGAAGEAFYPPPSVEWTPQLYPPLYFEVTARLVAVLGESFVPLRLVSILASLGTSALLFFFVRREGGGAVPGALAGCLFLAAFGIGDGYLDIGRVDPLGLFLTVLGAYLVRHGTRHRTMALAGVVFVLAFLTKQSAVVTLAPVALWALLRNPRTGLTLCGSFALPALGHWLWLNVDTDWWYHFYCFEMIRGHPVHGPAWVQFWTRDLLAALPLACGLSLAWLVTVPFTSRERRPPWFHVALAGGLIVSAWGGRLHHGGWLNVMQPGYAALALLSGLALAAVTRVTTRPGSPLVLRAAAIVLCAVQLGLLRYDPATYLPTDADRQGGERVVEVLRSFEGEVLVPDHPYLALLAGKAGSAQTACLWDVLRADTGEVGKELRKEWARALIERRFDAVVLNDLDVFPIFDMVEFPFNYRKERALLEDEDTFKCVAGIRTRPAMLWVRR